MCKHYQGKHERNGSLQQNTDLTSNLAVYSIYIGSNHVKLQGTKHSGKLMVKYQI